MFLEFRKLIIIIGLALPLSTASGEGDFSTQNPIKSKKRVHLGDDHVEVYFGKSKKPLVSKPQPLCKSERVVSRAEILKKLLERQNEDPYGISAASKVLSQNDAERYSERFKPKSYDKYKWDRRLFPIQLYNERPKRNKNKLKSNIQNAEVKPAINRAKQLEKLEEKDDPTTTEQNKEEDEQNSEQGSDAMNEDDDLDDDELLEESADYVSSYFDNGEGYLDEDENLDDDAVY